MTGSPVEQAFHPTASGFRLLAPCAWRLAPFGLPPPSNEAKPPVQSRFVPQLTDRQSKLTIKPLALKKGSGAYIVWERRVLDTAKSKNGVLIRLTDERWAHITEEHCELAGLRFEVIETLENPSRILMGGKDELLAIGELTGGKHLVVVYREVQGDGFVITAFLTSKTRSLNRRTQVWPG
jgi:hypothetical protein